MGYNVDFDSSAPVFENHTNFNIDNVVPEKRNNTYGSNAVHRKSMNELLSTSFSEDQQKVLAYALEHSGGGGGGVEIVNITATGTLPNISGTADKTHAELLSAYNSGKVIIANVEIPQGGGPALDATPLAFTDYMDGVFSGNVVLHNASNAWMIGVSYSSYSLYLHATKISVTQ